MYRWDLDIISSLVLMMTAMSHVVVRFLFVTLLGVQGHPREGIAKSLQGMVVKHANIMIVNVSMSTVACDFLVIAVSCSIIDHIFELVLRGLIEL